jgi:hypothetical protein
VRTTTVTCDRCRCAIRADPATIRCLGILKDTLGQADRCGPCAGELLDWLRSARKNDGARQTSLDYSVSTSI